MERGWTWHTTRRTARVTLDPESAWDVVASGQDGPQWYVDAAPFVFRRWVDRLVRGPALRHPPPGRARLADGDRVGFWEVVSTDHTLRRLELEARVRAPGRVRLEARVDPDAAGAAVTVTIGLLPRGPLGRAYLVADLPARETVAELVMLHLLTILRRPPAPRST